jgi:hypothetical protein
MSAQTAKTQRQREKAKADLFGMKGIASSAHPTAITLMV